MLLGLCSLLGFWIPDTVKSQVLNTTKKVASYDHMTLTSALFFIKVQIQAVNPRKPNHLALRLQGSVSTRKQSGRWACFFEQMGDQNVHLFEGEARVMNIPPICLEKQATPKGPATVCAWTQIPVAAVVTTFGAER